jgi:glycosyltransferase involved in cell wall biosynthesis
VKITFILGEIAVAGGVKGVFEYANRLQKRGHEVTVVYPLIPMIAGIQWNNPNRLARQISNFLSRLVKGNKVQRFQFYARLKGVPYFPQRYKMGLVEAFIPDGDIVVATAWPTAYFVSNLSKRKGEKFYFIQHYEAWDMWNEPQLWDRAKETESDPLRLPLAVASLDTKNFSFHRLRQRVDGTYRLPLHRIVISSWLRNLLEERFNLGIEALITNGINCDEFFNEDKRYNLKKRILMLYHPARWKGIEDGIRAFELARERHPDIQLVMFGACRGPGIPDYAEFHENISSEELRTLYCSCDIFVCPSWVEGYQAPPMEAMACKCAVVATAVGGIPDYSIPRQTALVSPPRSPELLAEGIIRLLDNEKLLRSISEAGHRYIRNFSWDKATDKLEQTFLKYADRKVNA